MPAAHGAGNENASRISPGNEQHENNRALQHPKQWTDVANEVISETDILQGASLASPAGDKLAHLRFARHRLQLRLRLCQRATGLEPPDQVEEAVAGSLPIPRIETQRQPNSHSRIDQINSRRHHSGDGALHAIHRDRATNDVTSSCERSLPELVRNDGDTSGMRKILLGSKGAAEQGRAVQRLEERCSGANCRHPLRPCRGINIYRGRYKRTHAGKHASSVQERQVLRC